MTLEKKEEKEKKVTNYLSFKRLFFLFIVFFIHRVITLSSTLSPICGKSCEGARCATFKYKKIGENSIILAVYRYCTSGVCLCTGYDDGRRQCTSVTNSAYCTLSHSSQIKAGDLQRAEVLGKGSFHHLTLHLM